jgi:hypothetical protein
MYRVIDTVSIDVASIRSYYPGRKPREEGSVDGSTEREARLEAVPGSRAFVPKDGLQRLAQFIEEFSKEGAGRSREGSLGVFSGD